MDKLEFAFPPSSDATFPQWRLGILKALANEASVPLVKVTNETKYAGTLPRKCKTPAIKAGPGDWISEFGCVCRYLGSLLETDLYPSFQSLPYSNERASQIDQWIDYCVNQLDNNYGLPLVQQLSKR